MRTNLIELARLAIEESIHHQKLIDTDEYLEADPELKTSQATFVTLTIDGNLRGCIGSLLPYRPLIDDLISNAKAAAFEDPRFAPLTPEEFTQISIEVSLLSLPKTVPYQSIDELKNIIQPSIDGVILTLGERRATFLPQVWEQLPTFDLFFEQLCQKAGLGSDCLHHHPTIETYTVKKVH